jgi:hypothetical protein
MKVVVSDSIKTLLLRRLSLGLADEHTSQSQAIIGTPLLVPVPKKVILMEEVFITRQK